MRDGDDTDIRPWERQPNEPAKGFALFTAYLSTSPRSLRAALARLWREEGRAAESVRVPGSYQRMAERWRYAERAAAWDFQLAETERIAWEQKRREARARRLAALDRASSLLGTRLETMDETDVKKMPPHRLLDSLLKTMDAEREELVDTREDRAARRGEDEGPLPALEDRIPKPPEET